MSDELKECPHCGGEARKTLVLPGGFNRYGCGECAIYACNAEDWNRRTPGPATTMMVAKVRKQYSPGDDYATVFLEGEEAAAFIAEHESA